MVHDSHSPIEYNPRFLAPNEHAERHNIVLMTYRDYKAANGWTEGVSKALKPTNETLWTYKYILYIVMYATFTPSGQ